MRILSASILSAFLVAPAALAAGLSKSMEEGPVSLTVRMVGADRSGQQEFPSIKVSNTDGSAEYAVRATIELSDKDGNTLINCPFDVTVKAGQKDAKWDLRDCKAPVAEYLQINGFTVEKAEPLAPAPDID